MKKLFLYAAATALALCLHATAWSAELSAENQTRLINNVEGYAPRMWEVAFQIWSMPELGYQENKTSALLQSELHEGRLQGRRRCRRHSDSVHCARGHQ